MRRWRDPILWLSAAQIAKTVAATVGAWVLTAHVFHMAQPFLAPWAALLTVHATVFGSLKRALQQVGASLIGVLLAFAAGLLGLNALSLGAAVLVGLLVGSVPRLRLETTTAAATALVVLTTGYSGDSGMLLSRLLETSVGAAIGLLVNLLVWPPLRDRSAAARIDAIDDRIGDLLVEMAEAVRGGRIDVRGWVARTRALDDDIEEAWRARTQARESGRLNPRRAARGRMHEAERFDAILDRLEQAVAETRSLAGTIRLAPELDPDFVAAWAEHLRRAGEAVRGADARALAAVRGDVAALAREREPSGDAWPVYGALIVNLRNIAAALDVVADAQPVEVPSPALVRGR
jgi:uncharacterized membrane protein YccC